MAKITFILKDTNIIEQTAQIDTVVFDKTGTITANDRGRIEYEGLELTDEEKNLLGGSLRASNHPLSRSLYKILDKNNISTPDDFTEHTGLGLETSYKDLELKIGSSTFMNRSEILMPALQTEKKTDKTSVHVSSNNQYKGCFSFHNSYREGLSDLFRELSKEKQLIILSGDNDGERERLSHLVPEGTKMYFEQKPGDKLQFIKNLQKQNHKVMMVGDGLNDAGALAQSNVGIVISEDINVFSPACDGILDAKRFKDLGTFFKLSERAIIVIKLSFLLSLCYNLLGLAFAVTGNLMPVVAAILMPLSSISIVIFTTLATQYLAKKLKN